MRVIYFPDAISGWLFFGMVMSLLAVATYTDQRARVVPKWLTLPALGLGILVSILRGCWLAANDLPVWAFGSQGVFLGALDGFLFALTGFAAGFGLIFLLWILGVCGGGDVKLFAALGAWIGPVLVFWVLAASLVFLSFYLVGYLAVQVLRGRNPVAGMGSRKRHPRGAKEPNRPRVIVKYSAIVAASAAVVLLWALRADLHLVERPNPSPLVEARSHGR